MGSNILSEQRKWYQKTFSENDESAASVDWNSRVKQRFRFRRIARLFRPALESPSVLDVGCGGCHFHEFLSKVLEKHDYTAIDIVPEVIEESKEKHPEIDAVTRDLVEQRPGEGLDFVVLSGTLNRLPDGVDEND
jgi:trans-aconitate methyltransferase